MTVLEAVGLAVAGFMAGGVNAVAGGGSLISFPALIAAGYAPVTANVTNTVAIWPGYLGSTVRLRGELADQRERVRTLAGTCVVGALAGTIFLLAAPGAWFGSITPVLLLIAAGLVAGGPGVSERVRNLPGGGGEHRSLLLHIATFGAAAYGAYFGAGVSVVMLGVLGVFLRDVVQRLNALRSILVLIINTVALLIFGVFGPVAWDAAAVMALTSLAGGWAGAAVAQRLSPKALRVGVVTIAIAVAVVMIVQ